MEPPSVAYVEFDPREPPSGVPRNGGGGAWCHSVFEIDARVAAAIEMLTPTLVRAHPTAFDITTRLKTTIYTPRNSARALLAHEEGHRSIAEHYYGNAAEAARAAAASVQSRAFEADGVDREAAEQAVAALIRSALRDAYMRETHARSVAANARYDAVTRHGLEAIAAADAVVGAIAEDP